MRTSVPWPTSGVRAPVSTFQTATSALIVVVASSLPSGLSAPLKVRPSSFLSRRPLALSHTRALPRASMVSARRPSALNEDRKTGSP